MSRPIGCNQGDPNAFTTYTGGVMQMTLADGVSATSDNLVLTQMNQVQFCGNLTLPEGTVSGFEFAVLPSACCPENPVHIVCPMSNRSGKLNICRVIVNESGRCTLFSDYYVGTDPFDPYRLYLDSCGFDIASVHYGSYNPS